MECKESKVSFYSQLNSKEKWKIIYVFTCILACCLCFYIFSASRHLVEQSDYKTVSRDEKEIQFDAYLKVFGKKYSGEEYFRRFNNFKESIAEIEKLRHAHRHATKKAEYGFTKFSDMSKKEFGNTMMTNTSFEYFKYGKNDYDVNCSDIKITTETELRSKHYLDFDYNKNDTKVDWRDRGAVGDILDQEGCSSCWAHCTVGIMESMVRISNFTQRHQYSKLSIQELIECSTYTKGCDPGSPLNALEFLCYEHWPIVSVDNYPEPLRNRDGDCKYKDAPKHGVIASNIMVRFNMDPLEIAHVVKTHGPVMATVNAFQWLNYLGGVIQYDCSSDPKTIRHVVQIVGYNKEDPELPYFIVRNSYGTDWGDHGYVYIAMTGICGIGSQIGYLDVAIV